MGGGLGMIEDIAASEAAAGGIGGIGSISCCLSHEATTSAGVSCCMTDMSRRYVRTLRAVASSDGSNEYFDTLFARKVSYCFPRLPPTLRYRLILLSKFS
jgi:hypothetical protein